MHGRNAVFNPFAEVADADSSDDELVAEAQHGNRVALEKLILRHQAWIYNIAIRMVFHPQDAEEVTQEVLVKVITKLSTFNGESKFRTWLYRIAANHVLNMKRRSAETKVTTFADYGTAIDRTPDLDLPDRKSVPSCHGRSRRRKDAFASRVRWARGAPSARRARSVFASKVA